MFLKLVAVFFIPFSAFASSLTYPANADFSDIFKGYGIKKEEVTIKKLDDDLQPLSGLDYAETVQIAKLLPDDFDKIRKFEIIPNDKSLYSSIIAKCILEKILILFQYGDNQSFMSYDALGNKQKYFSKEVHLQTTTTTASSEICQDPEEQQLQEWLNYDISRNKKLKDVIAAYPTATDLTEEQKCLILSIRQAVLKIAQSPVGRRLFLRILKSIGERKIIILPVKDSFSLLSKSLWENLVVTVPWLTETFPHTEGSESQLPTTQSTVSTPHAELAHIPAPSTFDRPGSGAKLTSTWKQMSIRKDDVNSSEAKIIGKNGEMKDDVKPFYISLCHELIHVLHKLENKTVNLSEQETNKKAFELVYKTGIWEKNLEALDAEVIANSILGNFTGELSSKIASNINRLIDFIIFLHHHGADEKVIDFMIKRLLDTCNENEGYIKLLKERIVSYTKEDLSTNKMPYTGGQFETEQNEIKNKLFKSFIKDVCLFNLNKNYIKDYKDGEEFYTVMGLRYNSTNCVFEIDNVSEMTFNAFESNKVMRISYDSGVILSSNPKSILLNTFVSKLKSSLDEETTIIDANFVLGILTGKEKSARIDGCLETRLQEQIGIKKDEEDLFFW